MITPFFMFELGNRTLANAYYRAQTWKKDYP